MPLPAQVSVGALSVTLLVTAFEGVMHECVGSFYKSTLRPQVATCLLHNCVLPLAAALHFVLWALASVSTSLKESCKRTWN